MESVKQGSACVGLRSSNYAVIGALKRSVNELASHQKKIMCIDNHMGIAIAGLTADARSLAKVSVPMPYASERLTWLFDPAAAMFLTVNEEWQQQQQQRPRRHCAVLSCRRGNIIPHLSPARAPLCCFAPCSG